MTRLDSENIDDKATDRSLVRRLKRGSEDGDAATRLYHKYADKLISFARRKTAKDLAVRVDPEEIVQSVFRTFFRRAADGCYDVPPGDELWKLLLVIALNKVRRAGEYHRAAKRDVGMTLGSSALELSQLSRTDQGELAQKHLEMVVEELLGGHKPLHRTMVELRIEGYEVAEIAGKTKRSKRSVERVLKDFRKELDDELQEELR